MKLPSIPELQRLLELQRLHYGEAIDKIVMLCHQAGQSDLANAARGVKMTYGLVDQAPLAVRILHELNKCDNTQADLVRQLNEQPAKISEALDRLIASRLVERFDNVYSKSRPMDWSTAEAVLAEETSPRTRRLSRREARKKSLYEAQQEISALFETRTTIRAFDLLNILKHLSRERVSSALKAMVDQGDLVRTGHARGSTYTVKSSVTMMPRSA